MQFSIRIPLYQPSWWLDPPSRQEDIRAANAKLHSRANLVKFARECSLAFALPISSWWLDPPSRQEDIRAANAKLHSRANLVKFARECSLAFAFKSPHYLLYQKPSWLAGHWLSQGLPGQGSAACFRAFLHPPARSILARLLGVPRHPMAHILLRFITVTDNHSQTESLLLSSGGDLTND